MSHTPDRALFTGLDAHGNYRYTVESGSHPGEWHLATLWANGTGGVCTCEAYGRRGTCTIVESAAALIQETRRHQLATQLIDLSAGIMYNVQEFPDHVLDDDTAYRARRLLAEADQLLADARKSELAPVGGNTRGSCV